MQKDVSTRMLNIADNLLFFYEIFIHLEMSFSISSF